MTIQLHFNLWHKLYATEHQHFSFTRKVQCHYFRNCLRYIWIKSYLSDRDLFSFTQKISLDISLLNMSVFNIYQVFCLKFGILESRQCFLSQNIFEFHYFLLNICFNFFSILASLLSQVCNIWQAGNLTFNKRRLCNAINHI